MDSYTDVQTKGSDWINRFNKFIETGRRKSAFGECLSASTITTYISGISTMHKLNGHTDNTKSFLVTKILEGSKRKNSPKADLRLPVSMNLLKRLIQSLPFVCTSVFVDKFYVGYVNDVLPGSTFTLTSYFTNAKKSEKTQTERACEHSGFIYWRTNKGEWLN
jgi:hypothetical protein